MRHLNAIPALLTAVLLAGCGVAGDSHDTKEGKQSGGTLHV